MIERGELDYSSKNFNLIRDSSNILFLFVTETILTNDREGVVIS